MSDIWTLEALKMHIDQRFAEMRRAIDKAETSLDSRLEGMNEFRAQILSERAHFVTQDNYNQKHDQLDQQIDEVRRTYVSADKHDALMEKTDVRFASMERFQSRLIGALILVSVVLPIMTTTVVYLLTKR